MAKSLKKTIKEGYNRLKKVLEKAMPPKKEQAMPSLILQPVRNRNYPNNYQ
jgi:hypothetical protein